MWLSPNEEHCRIIQMTNACTYVADLSVQNDPFRAQMALKPGNDKLCGPIPRDFSKVTDEYLNILPDGTFHACPNNDLSAGGIAGETSSLHAQHM